MGSLTPEVECRACGARNPATGGSCWRCRASLLGCERVPFLPEREPSWGRDLLEKARARREETEPCKSCGAENPVRFVRCQTCRGSTKRVELPSHLRCDACDEWNRSTSRFCERCGHPLASTADPALWRPDGCPGCWGDVVAQPGLAYCGTCGAPLPATLLDRRAVLASLVAHRAGGGYRGEAAPVAHLHPARPELALERDGAEIWIRLRDSERGVIDLDLTGAPLGEAEAREAPSSLIRLARWVRRRLKKDERMAEARFLATVEDACEAGERVVSAQRAGPSVLARVECARLPSAKRLGAWAEHVARWALAPPG